MNGAEQNHTFAERHLKARGLGRGTASEFPTSLAMDSKRSKDINGYLHVEVSPLTKETVNQYYGYEIPNYQELGLEPEKIYYGYRKGLELEKSISLFNGIPVLSEHKIDSADNPLKNERVGYTGTSAIWQAPYVMNALIITDSKAIELIENNEQRELSASYRYTPIFETGEFGGERYDFVMTDIKPNHIALVSEGRAGSDVLVYDSNLEGENSAFPLPPSPIGKVAAPNLCENISGLVIPIVSAPSLLQNSSQLKIKNKIVEQDKNNNSLDRISQTVGDKTMAKNVEELKSTLEALVNAFNEYLSQELEEETHASDNEEEAMVTEDGETEQASDEEVAENQEKEETAQDSDEVEEEKEVAQDKAISRAAFDSAIKRAEERGASRAINKIKSLYSAATDVKHTLSVNPLAYDSAADIYKEALLREKVDISGVEKSAYPSLYKSIMKNKNAHNYNISLGAMDSKEEIGAFEKNIKVMK